MHSNSSSSGAEAALTSLCTSTAGIPNQEQGSCGIPTEDTWSALFTRIQGAAPPQPLAVSHRNGRMRGDHQLYKLSHARTQYQKYQSVSVKWNFGKQKSLEVGSFKKLHNKKTKRTLCIMLPQIPSVGAHPSTGNKAPATFCLTPHNLGKDEKKLNLH